MRDNLTFLGYGQGIKAKNAAEEYGSYLANS